VARGAAAEARMVLDAAMIEVVAALEGAAGSAGGSDSGLVDDVMASLEL